MVSSKTIPRRINRNSLNEATEEAERKTYIARDFTRETKQTRSIQEYKGGYNIENDRYIRKCEKIKHINCSTTKISKIYKDTINNKLCSFLENIQI